MILQSLTDAARTFEYDYIYLDAILLTIWLLVVIKYKKWSALKAGLLFGIAVYFIDAVFWWNITAGSNTFELQARAGSGTGKISRTRMWVQPI